MERTGPVRDRPGTSLSRTLEAFWRDHGTVESVVLVDAQGECVEYCTALDPYTAQVAAATWLSTTVLIGDALKRLRGGELRQWIWEGERGGLVARKVGDDLCVIVLLLPGGLGAHLLLALDGLVAALRDDAGTAPPRWEPDREPWLSIRPTS